VRRRLAAVAIVTAGLLSACGGGAAPAPSATTTTTSGSAHGSWAHCLAEHGVPNPPLGPAAPAGVDPQTWAKAKEACADKAPGPVG
jgi:hypothetical protein